MINSESWELDLSTRIYLVDLDNLEYNDLKEFCNKMNISEIEINIIYF